MSHINVICLRVRTTENTEKETRTYGHIRPSSFGMPLLFYCRHLWSSPVGLGFSTRLAQARDSLSGERFLTPLPQCSALWSPCSLRDAARDLVVRYSVGAVLTRLLSMSKPIAACTSSFYRHSSLVSRGPLGCCWCPPSSKSTCHPSLRAVSRGTGAQMTRLPKALAMRYASGR